MNGGQGERDRGGQYPDKFVLAELITRLDCVVKIGRIRKAIYDKGVKVRVEMEGVNKDGKMEKTLTDWIPWCVARAGNNRTYVAPETNEQVVVFSPSGDMRNAFVLGAINCEDYPHVANHPDYEKTVYQHREKTERETGENDDPTTSDDDAESTQALDAFLEFNRRSGIRRWWIKEEGGTFRWEIGERANMILDREHFQVRIGTTQLVMREDSIKLHIKGRATELKLTPESIIAHVADKGEFVITADQIQGSVTGTGILKILAGLVEASVENEGVLSVRKNSIQAKLESMQVRIGLFPSQVKVWVRNAWLRLTMQQGELRVPGSVVQVNPSNVTIQSPQFLGVQGQAAGGPYEAGDPSFEYVTPERATPHETKEPPEPPPEVKPERPPKGS